MCLRKITFKKIKMARRKSGDHVRTLTKVAGGKSLCIAIPLALVRALDWGPSQKVCIKKWGNRLIITDAEEMEKEGKKC